MRWGRNGSRRRSRERALRPWHYTFAVVVLVLGLGLSLSIFTELRGRQRKQTREEFTRVARDCQAALRWNLSADIAAAEAFHAFHRAAGGLDEEKFRSFATLLLRQYPSVAAFEWVPRVRASDRDRWEGRDGANLTISELTAARLVVRAKDRDDYYPVSVVATAPARGKSESASPVLGLDLASDPARAEAMRLACDLGRATGAARPVKLMEIGQQSAWVIVDPIFSGPKASATVEQRRANLEGYVLVAIQLDLVAREAWEQLKAQGISLYIFDGPAPSADGVVFSYAPGGGDLKAALSDDSRLRLVGTQELAGRVWTIVSVATPAFLEARQSWSPWVGLLIGLTFTGLLIGYVLGITVYSMRIRRLTARLARTNADLEDELERHRQTMRELHLWEQEFRALADHSPDIVARFDEEMRLLYVNSRIEEKTAHRRAAFVGRTYREIGMPEPMVGQWERAIRQVFKTGREAAVRIELPGPEGLTGYDCLLLPEFADEGFVQSVLAVNRAMRDRRQSDGRPSPGGNGQAVAVSASPPR